MGTLEERRLRLRGELLHDRGTPARRQGSASDYDDSDAQKLLRRMLAERGADVRAVATAREAYLASLLRVSGSLSIARLSVTDLVNAASPCTVVSHLTASGLLVIVVLAACLIPAWRAARLDPKVALQQE
jgi:hypothetical protein